MVIILLLKIRGICTERIRTLSLLAAEKIGFPTKPDIRTHGHKARRTDISNNRVALQLKRS